MNRKTHFVADTCEINMNCRYLFNKYIQKRNETSFKMLNMR